MSKHLTYEEAKKFAYYGLKLLAVLTVIEVIISLFGKGHLGWKEAYYLDWVHYICGGLIVILSLYKAYFIVFNFIKSRRRLPPERELRVRKEKPHRLARRGKRSRRRIHLLHFATRRITRHRSLQGGRGCGTQPGKA